MLPLVWVTDPWDTLDHPHDTTLRLIQECVLQKIPCYWGSSDYILNTEYLNSFNLSPCGQYPFNPQDLHSIHSSNIQHLLYRLDPPVDLNYLTLLKKIETTLGASIISNPPDLLRKSEKLLPSALQHYAAQSCVLSDSEQAQQCWHEHRANSKAPWNGFILKPLNNAQSKGVEKLNADLSLNEWLLKLETATQQWSTPVLAQEFLCGIHQGEIRLWYAFGSFIAALKKFPLENDFRVIIDQGSKIEAYLPSKAESTIIDEIGATLTQQKVSLAAIDLIAQPKSERLHKTTDYKIIDYNITSPGLLVQLEQAHQRNFAKPILQKLKEAFYK